MSLTRLPAIALPRRHSIDTILDSFFDAPGAVGTGAWPTANMAIYTPLRIPSRVVVKSLWYASGGTANDDYDIGLYDASGAAILRLGGALGGASTEVVWDCTDTTIGPGLYYMALVCSFNTDLFVRQAPAAPLLAASGVLTQDSAYPLPATATWTVNNSLAYIPFYGMFLDSVNA